MIAITTWLRSRAVAVLGGATLFVVAILVVRMDRYPEWDEAVFLSQSGGLNGVPLSPLKLVESREMGPPTLISIIRSFVANYSNTRLFWLILSVLLLVLGAVLIGRHLKVPPVLLVLIFGSYWVSLLFIGSFYGFFIAAAAALIATGCYLSLRMEPERQVYWGLALGASLSLTLWFRQIEGFLLLLCLVAHSVVVSPRAFWSRRIAGTSAAALTTILLFVIPWVVDSSIRFGSAAQRITGGSNQGFERGFSNQFTEYWQVLTGHSFHYARLGTTSSSASVVLTACLVILVALALWGYWRSKGQPAPCDDGVSVGAVPLVWAIGAVLVGFFAFYIESVRDRYLLMGLIFLFAWTLTGVWRLVDVYAAQLGRAIALGGFIIIWVATNSVIAHEYESGRFEAGRVTETYAQMLHALSGDQECIGISRFGAPEVAVGSGCRTIAMTSPELASERALELRAPGRTVFVWWPESEAELLELPVDDGWMALPRSDTEGRPQPVVMWWRGASTN